MVYKVILIEYGKITHSWDFSNDYVSALKQLERLVLAFEEVNEVSATLLKVGQSERNVPLSNLYKNRII